MNTINLENPFDYIYHNHIYLNGEKRYKGDIKTLIRKCVNHLLSKIGYKIDKTNMASFYKSVSYNEHPFRAKAVNSANNSVSACIGEYSVAITTGENSIAANTGFCNEATAISDGVFSASITTGFNSISLSVDDFSIAASTSGRSTAVCKGHRSLAVTMMENSFSITEKENSIAMALGRDSKAKGVLGSWIIIADVENNVNNKIKDIKVLKIDGKKIKADTYYQLKNGEIIQVSK